MASASHLSYPSPPRLIHPSIAIMKIHITAFDASTPAQSIAAFAWRLARRTSAVLMAATLGWAALPSPSFAQANGARDVAGIVLGMSPGEVETVLRARNPSFKMLKVYWRAADGKPGTAVAKLGGALPSGPSDRINTSRGYSRPEAIMVYFTQTDGKAFAVYRQVVNKQTGMSAPEIEAQLKAKYGTPDGFKGQYRLYRRMLDDKGQPNPGCGHRGFDWESAPGSQSRGCGLSVEAQFSDPIGPDVYMTFQTWMVDHQMAERDARAGQERQREAANDAATKVQKSARGNLPRL